MKWFKEEEFDRVRKLIDDANVKGVNDWYWEDFKNNATTLALAYVYAKMNNKDKKVTTKLETILAPNGKTGPLEFNDVVAELWNHDATKAIKSINILLDNDIPFQTKSGDLAYEFLANPAFENVAKAVETNPDIISKYMKAEEKAKVKSALLNSDNYEMVKAGMSNDLFSTQNNKVRAYQKSAWNSIARTTLKIKNVDLRKRYLSEFILKKGNTLENLFDVILDLYKAGTYSIGELPTVFKGLGWNENGNGSSTQLIYHLHTEGKGETIKLIGEMFDGNIWAGILKDFRLRPHNGGEKLYGAELETAWLVPYFDQIVASGGLSNLTELIPYGDETFAGDVMEKYPETVELVMNKYPDKISQVAQDIFLF